MVNSGREVGHSPHKTPHVNLSSCIHEPTLILARSLMLPCCGELDEAPWGKHSKGNVNTGLVWGLLLLSPQPRPIGSLLSVSVLTPKISLSTLQFHSVNIYILFALVCHAYIYTCCYIYHVKCGIHNIQHIIQYVKKTLPLSMSLAAVTLKV